MITVKVRVRPYNNGHTSVVPIVVPDIDEVKAFAAGLHAGGKVWQGEVFGWPAEYHPERPERPLDSKMSFTPADFCIGESGIWFFSLMWENGKDAEPVEFLDDRNLLSQSITIQIGDRVAVEEAGVEGDPGVGETVASAVKTVTR